jgi:plastocyanin
MAAESGKPMKRSCAARAIAFLVCGTAAACSRQTGPPATAAPPPAASAVAAPALPASSSGTVSGTVSASGTAVVVLEPKTERSFPPQAEKPVMDQVGLTFGPELLIVRTGEPVEFRNNDDTLHNVNVKNEDTREQAFNVAIPTGGVYVHTFRKDGFYRVGCDIHPAMAASIFSATTPFAAVAESGGRFTFTDVPPGAWSVTVYTGGKQLRRDVDVKAGVTDVTVE